MDKTTTSAQEPTSPVEEQLKKIQELERGHAQKQERPKITISDDQRSQRQRSHSISPQQPPCFRAGVDPYAVKFNDRHYLNILQSMGQALHILDVNYRLIYWNRTAEQLYGYSAAEALGQNPIELLTDAGDYGDADHIVHQVKRGESWTGQFPVKNKRGDRFIAFATSSPLYDDNDTFIGVITISSDARLFQETGLASMGAKQLETNAKLRDSALASSKLGVDPQQPLQVAIASKIFNLASKVSDKVKSKIKTGERSVLHQGGNGDTHYSNHAFSGDESEGKQGIYKIITSKAEEWMAKKSLPWSWKGNERDASEARTTRFLRRWLNNDQDNEFNQSNSYNELKPDNQLNDTNWLTTNEASGFWSSSFSVNSTSSASSCGSSRSSTVNKVDTDADSLDYEILWEDLTIGENIGEGSCGTVYHGLWYESDVAVKLFSKQEYSDEVIYSFKQEVSLMKQLQHPNILLFIGAITSLQRLCIVTEFLPRGSLFSLLHKNSFKLEWRRRIRMALDIARGMNYLHRFNPPIVHRDLKSSNLLVDKNWTIKVGDFGLSRLKYETYLATKSGKGMPQWMAPEVLRGEHSNEKSDIYSFGVILWELATEKIPWDNLNSMQVIGAVGFMNQRLDIPKDVHPQWASIIESCWHSEPKCRPSFQELVERLNDLQRQYVIQAQTASSTAGDSIHKEQ